MRVRRRVLLDGLGGWGQNWGPTAATQLDPPSTVDAVRRDMNTNVEHRDAYEGYVQARRLEASLPGVLRAAPDLLADKVRAVLREAS